MGPDYLIPAVINTKIGNVNGYATRDLFVPHPISPGYWKSHGRVDDQILHSTAQMVRVLSLILLVYLMSLSLLPEDESCSSGYIFIIHAKIIIDNYY
jgi:hypothetical protein